MTKLASGPARIQIQADQLDRIYCQQTRQRKQKILEKEWLAVSSEPAGLENSVHGPVQATAVKRL